MRMVQCVSLPSSGALTVLGHDVRADTRAIKARLGVVPQDNNLDLDTTVRSNLLVYARYFDVSRRDAARRVDELLEFVELRDRADDLIPELSGSTKRRLVLARAMINSPELLLLDEPTTGLDPQARQWVWSRLRGLRAAGVTMLLTTHCMEEAAQLCDRIALIDAGKLFAEGEPGELVREHVGDECIEIRPLPGERTQIDACLDGIVSGRQEQVGDTIYMYPQGEVDWSTLHAIPSERLLRRSATLGDVFLRLTGREMPE
jgi:lipooligosaccharide transport system ATP-binding protein